MLDVNRAVADLRRGSFVVIESQGEAVLTQAAESVTPESLAQLGRSGGGRPRLALTANRARVLDFPTSDAAVVLLPLGDSISADIVRSLVDPTRQIGEPMPVLPQPVAIQAAAEDSCASAAVRLSKIAEMLPAAITAPLLPGAHELLGRDVANYNPLRVDARAIGKYPMHEADTIQVVSKARLPLAATEDAQIVGFRPADGGSDHFAILIGDPINNQPPLCRLHSECFTGDILGSLRCDCGPQLNLGLEIMGDAGHGILLYLAQEGRGIGLMNKLRAYQLQDAGLDTVDANVHLGYDSDERTYRVAANILRHFGIGKVRLLTNNPIKVETLASEGVDVVERVPHAIPANAHNRSYLETKARRSGHLIDR